jgi:hypothetical protein
MHGNRFKPASRYAMWNRDTRRQVIDGKEHGQQGKGTAAAGNSK